MIAEALFRGSGAVKTPMEISISEGLGWIWLPECLHRVKCQLCCPRFKALYVSLFNVGRWVEAHTECSLCTTAIIMTDLVNRMSHTSVLLAGSLFAVLIEETLSQPNFSF